MITVSGTKYVSSGASICFPAIQSAFSGEMMCSEKEGEHGITRPIVEIIAALRNQPGGHKYVNEQVLCDLREAMK